MRTFDELERRWSAAPPLPRGRGTVQLIVLRGPREGERELPRRATLSPERGLHGDRWETEPDRELDCQITLMTARAAELVAGGASLGLPGDNFLVDLDLSEEALPAGSRLRLGAAILEVTAEPHLGCKSFRARFGPGALRWVNWKEFRDRRLRGVNCKVIEAGEVRVGDEVAAL